ncbi:MAG: CopG family transcriptional regulator [Pararhodobacter sp.]|nr:CopG family transcriptional regulator [Pararhodobacter sp.]
MTITTPLRAALAAIALAAGLALAPAADAGTGTLQADTLHVTLTPSCGCCGAWAELAGAHGFSVEIEITEDYVAMKDAAGVPDALWSCHTARIGGYIIEGHVPFEAIEQLLEERPEITGIAVPGMPAGSPGMGNDPNAAYDVIAFGGAASDGALFHRVGN